jgi:hypothetical protein
MFMHQKKQMFINKVFESYRPNLTRDIALYMPGAEVWISDTPLIHIYGGISSH